MNALNAAQELLALVTHPRTGVLIGLLVTAALIDWRTLRIPNWLTLGGMVYGLACNAALAPPLHGGILTALTGLTLGLVIFLPLYMLRAMGAGDVKLMAMVGAFVGVPHILYAVLCTAIAGGLAALAFAAYHRALRRMTGNVVDTVQSMVFAAAAGLPPTAASARPSVGKLPYGISITVGTLASLLASPLGFA